MALSKREKYVNIQGKLLKLTNLDKVFYPECGFRKADILNYYLKVGPTVLPYLRDRPFTLNRFPDGVDGLSFYEKQCPHHREKWVQTARFGTTNHCLVNDLPTLLWAVNLAAIELHTTLGTIADLQCPTMLMFDLDPGEGADIRQCVEVALLIRRLFARLKLESFPKTSGKKGLHLVVPLNTQTSFKETRAFSRSVAEDLEASHPDLVTSKMLKIFRGGRVYIDWHQNVDFKSTTTAYSLRASDRPTVSTPVTWQELMHAQKRESEALRLLTFESSAVLERVKRVGDLHAPVLSLNQKLPSPLVLKTRIAA